MFSVRLKKVLQSPSGNYLLVFIVIFFSLALFIAGALLYVRNELKDYCSNDVAVRMENYLQARAAGVIYPEMSSQGRGGMHGLEFVRLMSAGEQMFFTESPGVDLELRQIVDLEPGLTATWIILADHDEPSYWTIRSQSMSDGRLVQAGMRHKHIVQLYLDLKRGLMFMLLPALFLSAGITLFCRRKSIRSLAEAEHSLADVVAGKGSDLLEENSNSELRRLYQLLNRVISQNNQLILEMQESLDNVAHDLRTPMTRLRSVAEYGLHKNTPEKLGEALADCLEESEKVLSMLSIMMSVVEAESGTMRLNIEEVELSSTIADVINLYEYVADENNIELQMDIDADIVIRADKTRIRQVWANLVDNAIKYGSSGGYVHVHAASTERSISVFFKDNGMGISSMEQSRIWERLFRGDRSRTKQGLGLGLNYVRAVVEAHGGRVSVESHLSKGSCFEVQLPR
jgi:signal transduction histidine kinase